MAKDATGAVVNLEDLVIDLPPELVQKSARHEAAHAVARWVVEPARHPGLWLWDSIWVAARVDWNSPCGMVEHIQPLWSLFAPCGVQGVLEAEAIVSLAGPLQDLLDDRDGCMEAVRSEWADAMEEGLSDGVDDWEKVDDRLESAPGMELTEVVETTLRMLQRPEFQQAIGAIADKLLAQEPDEAGRLYLEWDDVAGLLPEVGAA